MARKKTGAESTDGASPKKNGGKKKTNSSVVWVIASTIFVGALLVLIAIYVVQSTASKEDISSSAQDAAGQVKEDLEKELNTIKEQVNNLEGEVDKTAESIENTEKKLGQTSYTSDALGISFAYPKTWGEVRAAEKGFTAEDLETNPDAKGTRIEITFSGNSNVRMDGYSADYAAYASTAYRGDKDLKGLCRDPLKIETAEGDVKTCYINPSKVEQLYYITRAGTLPEGDATYHLQNITQINLKDDVYTGFEFIQNIPEATAQVNATEDVAKTAENYVKNMTEGDVSESVKKNIDEYKQVVESFTLVN